MKSLSFVIVLILLFGSMGISVAWGFQSIRQIPQPPLRSFCSSQVLSEYHGYQNGTYKNNYYGYWIFCLTPHPENNTVTWQYWSYNGTLSYYHVNIPLNITTANSHYNIVGTNRPEVLFK